MKKKFIGALVAVVLALPCIIGLSGCGDKHTHDFDTDVQYEIVAEVDGKSVYSFHQCSCGEKDEGIKVEDAIILSQDPEDENYYQNHFVDSVISNKLFVFESGEWGKLELFYPFENVTFVGTEGAIFKDVIHIKARTDSVKNITIKNMRFETSSGRLFIVANDGELDGVTIENCEFDAKEEENENQAIHIICATSVHIVKNTTIRNCKVDGFKQGVLIYGGHNVTIDNCEFLNTKHNGIALQTRDSSNNNLEWYCSGDIKITNNKFISPDDRAIRFGVVKNANIEISGNIFEDGFVENNEIELVKTQITLNTKFVLTNNTYDGNRLDEVDETYETINNFIFLV